ncbi:unnamed protein product [marine sediment metagenome]|uniref:Uncharacterized protein n=1 Tax=marine sediment metagenome TaxID=412755 RepID=X1RSI7_9ZZZZ
MTVERLIELLRREYPQALVSIAAPKPLYASLPSQRGKYDLLCISGIDIAPETGAVHIICDRHDC